MHDPLTNSRLEKMLHHLVGVRQDHRAWDLAHKIYKRIVAERPLPDDVISPALDQLISEHREKRLPRHILGIEVSRVGVLWDPNPFLTHNVLSEQVMLSQTITVGDLLDALGKMTAKNIPV